MRKMNKKQIESRIIMESKKNDVPDLKQQILAQVPNRKVVEKEQKKGFNLGIRFSYVLTLCFVVLLAVVIFNNNNVSPNNPVTKTVGSVEKAYAKQIVTLAGFAADIDTTQMVSYVSMLSESEDTNYDDVASKINEYFKVVSLLLDEENTKYEIEVLENSEYTYKLTTKYTVLSNEYETIIYYNEKPLEDKYKDKDDLDENEPTIEGVVEQGEIRKNFFGNKKIEEDEIEVEITLEIDEERFLKVSHEKETDEKEMKYEFYLRRPGESSEPYREVHIKFDEEDKSVSVKFKEDEEDVEMKFYYNKENNERVEVDYFNGKKWHDDIFIDDDEEDRDRYRYDFGDGKHSYGDKPKGHGKPGDNDREEHDHDNDDRPW